MNIGEAANASGVSARLIRYYESIDLIPAASRAQSRYRVFTERDVNTLQFVKRARLLGFSLQRIGQLVDLWQSRGRSQIDVRKIALEHVAELRGRILELVTVVELLQELARSCERGDRTDCPINRNLERAPMTKDSLAEILLPGTKLESARSVRGASSGPASSMKPKSKTQPTLFAGKGQQ